MQIDYRAATPEELEQLARHGNSLEVKLSARAEMQRLANVGDVLALARLTMALEDVRKTINETILPLAAHLGCPDEMLIQTMQIAAENIAQYQRQFRLQAVPVKGGDAMK